jgi:hypothetical protein
MSDIYTAGASRVVDQDGNNILPVVRTQLEVDPETNDAEDYGEIPLMPCLGITALPLAPDDDGRAELACIEGCGGFTAVCVGGRDARTVDVVGQLQPGEVALHSLGSNATKRSRVFCKEDSLSMLVGNDTAFVLNRTAKAATLSMPEAGQLELSKANGFMVGDTSGAGITLKDGKITLNAGQVSVPGGVHIGGSGAMPLVLSTGLMSYLGALEILLTTLATALDAKTPASPGVNVGAVTAFIGSGSALKTQMTALFTNGK